VVRLGGFGEHVPYHLTWAHELDADVAGLENRLVEVTTAHEVPQAVRGLARL
jgi:putative hydrolase of the HAD superfamily